MSAVSFPLSAFLASLMASVLIVDDHADVLASCEKGLASTEHTVFTAISGKAALKILAAEPIDVIVTDVVMPDFDGLELLGDVRKRFPRIKVIGMTGGSMHVDSTFYVDLMLKLGAIEMLTKPFTFEKLQATIEGVLERKEEKQS